ncbi:hypothetical protein [Geminisphaera colitermitum]|uniref:hypothetical protein n=1 Tax=Geminisphaera colitermitum TaxID=1148786 RepID=UPI001E51C30A|nr:hypothetical protein [Geminisphaera colitermitum]
MKRLPFDPVVGRALFPPPASYDQPGGPAAFPARNRIGTDIRDKIGKKIPMPPNLPRDKGRRRGGGGGGI